MLKTSRLLLLLCAISMAFNAHAFEAKDYPKNFDFAQYQDILSKVKCPVCDGETVDASNAVVAQQIRSQVLQAITVGKTSAQILQQLSDDYGNKFVDNKRNYYWLLPLVFLMLGGVTIYRLSKSR